MAVNKISESQCHPDLIKERRSATFNVDELTDILYFGKALNDRRRELIWRAFEDKSYRDGPPHAFLSQEQSYSDAIRRSAAYMKNIKEWDISLEDEKATIRQIMMPFGPFPLALHISMFINALENQSSKEQKAKWLPLTQSNRIIGTYAQTELGHGTNLRALETTATYDPSSEEFVIHSPTITSTKWWPGGLGKTANHVILMAQLFTKGVNYGMHSFIVQIRDLETHEPLPGITVGDIGPKFGYNMMDNGYLRFNHYRIPRENMLMKNAEVTKAGDYISKTTNKKLTYGTMVFIRTSIVWVEAARSLSESCTIAIRYSCVRRQSELKPGAPEPQILDYQTQQYKLLPLLATSYAFWFTGIQLFQFYFSFLADAQQGELEALPELHALSAGLKAFCSWGAMSGVEQCRLSCGGHGFSLASGIPTIYGNVATPACTYEGENTVMMLQTARYLVKVCESSASGKPISGHAAYLTERHFDKCVIGDNCDLQSLLAAYRFRAANAVKKAVSKLHKLASAGKEAHEAWNATSVDLVSAVSAHCHYVILKSFIEVTEQEELSAPVKLVLTQLCQLYATYGIVENSGQFLLGNFLSEDQLQCVQNKLYSLLSDLRPNAVALVDAFDYHDETLQSCLGRYDGRVYESLFEWAQHSPLNKTQVHESFHKYLKPMLRNMESKL